MKKSLYSLLLVFISLCVSRAQICTAVSVITLNPGGAGPIGAHMMVTYNPLRNVYYWNAGGFASNPVATYSANGGNTIAVGMGNQDWRGLWWNSNTNVLEGNCFNSIGIFSVSTDPVSGHALNGSNIIAPNNQPGTQSGGQYDAGTDQVIYYNTLNIYKYSRSSGNLINTIPISGLPGGIGSLNSNGFYTGINGMEYALYDYTNRRAYFINYTTGVYVSTVQFPLSAGAPSSFGISYANGLFFIYDNTNWVGFRSGLWASQTAPVCMGQSVTLNAQGASSYTWNTGSNSNSIVINPTVTTVYTVSGNAGSGCISTFTLSVPVIPSLPPLVSISGNTFVCGNFSNTLTASGANSYTWNTGSVSPSIVINPTISTNYMVTGTSSLGCVSNKTINVNAGPSPTITFSGNQNLCDGQSTTLTASGANSYSWNTGNTNSTLVITPSISTVYTVTGTSPNSCSDTKTVNVVVNPIPTVSISGSFTICNGSTVNLTGTGANNYTWSTGSIASSISISPNINTSYSIVGTTSAGCSATAMQTVTVLQSPTISALASSTAFCEGNSVNLSASGANSYTWSTGAMTASLTESPTTNTFYTVSGSNTVNACADTKTINITVYPAPILSILSPSILCLGESVTLSVNGANTYTWYNGANTTSITDTPTITTIYTVSGTGSNSCVATKSVNLIVTICNVIAKNESLIQSMIYPNPTNGNVKIEYFNESELDLEVITLEGKLLHQESVHKGKTVLDLKSYTPGIYFIRLFDKGSIVYTGKLVLTN